MSLWLETKQEIQRRNSDYDAVRRERIRRVENITERPLIVYATDFLNRQKVVAAGGEVIIDGKDKLGFDEVTLNIKGTEIDILIHSPGGDPDAAESIITLLRSRFSKLRFIVPDQAKSAATMMCCAGDEILMDERSELGPIDPQLSLTRGDGVNISAPAQAIINQFDIAKKELSKNPNQLPAWLPILQPLGPSLLTQCEAADKLARDLVESWLKSYMFQNVENGETLAIKIANFLANYEDHLSHGKRIGIEQLKDLGLVVKDLRQTPDLREAIWNLYLAISCTFDGTGAFKIIENGHGDALIRSIIMQKLPDLIPKQNPISRQTTSKKKRRK